MALKKHKSTFGKIWYFIWEDDSVWSWIVNIILAYVLIKFIVYPVLGFAFVTTHPIVAVVSNSMLHEGSFDDWWNSRAMCGGLNCRQSEFYSLYGISTEDFKNFKYRNGFRKGDIMVLYGTSPSKLKPGDVIVFQSQRPDPIIHRIIEVKNENNKFYFQTKGDHNDESITSGSLNELNIPEDTVIGRAIFRIPYLGYIKIWFVELLDLVR